MFGKNDTREERIAVLSQENEDLSDRLANEQQAHALAEIRAAAMVKARDPSKMDEIALTAASTIEDFHVRAWESVGQRKAAVQNLIRDLITNALDGGASQLMKD